MCNTEHVWKLILEKHLKRRLKGHELQKFQSIGYKDSLKHIICKASASARKALPLVARQHKSKFITGQESVKPTKRLDCSTVQKKTLETNIISDAKTGKTCARENTNTQIYKSSVNSSTRTPPRKIEDAKSGSQLLNAGLKNSARISKTAEQQKIKTINNKDMNHNQAVHSGIGTSSRLGSGRAVKKIQSVTS